MFGTRSSLATRRQSSNTASVWTVKVATRMKTVQLAPERDKDMYGKGKRRKEASICICEPRVGVCFHTPDKRPVSFKYFTEASRSGMECPVPRRLQKEKRGIPAREGVADARVSLIRSSAGNPVSSSCDCESWDRPPHALQHQYGVVSIQSLPSIMYVGTGSKHVQLMSLS